MLYTKSAKANTPIAVGVQLNPMPVEAYLRCSCRNVAWKGARQWQTVLQNPKGVGHRSTLVGSYIHPTESQRIVAFSNVEKRITALR
jgi:hypothetical protein